MFSVHGVTGASVGAKVDVAGASVGDAIGDALGGHSGAGIFQTQSLMVVSSHMSPTSPTSQMAPTTSSPFTFFKVNSPPEPSSHFPPSRTANFAYSPHATSSQTSSFSLYSFNAFLPGFFLYGHSLQMYSKVSVFAFLHPSNVESQSIQILYSPSAVGSIFVTSKH